MRDVNVLEIGHALDLLVAAVLDYASVRVSGSVVMLQWQLGQVVVVDLHCLSLRGVV